MNTDTDLANAALAYLGEMPISSIDDPASKPARMCRQFAREAMNEVLRMHRWNRATKRGYLARDVVAPLGGFSYAYLMPTDCLRVMEVNDDEYRESNEHYELEGRRLLTNDEAVTLRYVAEIQIADADPLLAQAMALRLAAKVCVGLTGSAEKFTLMMNLFGKALAEARQVDAQECGSRENPSWTRIFSRSRILRNRGERRNPLRLEDY